MSSGGDGMTHVSLFSGIGGLDLAAEAAGFKTVLQVEREPYALKVLGRHWPNVPRIHDVRKVTLERVQEIMADAEGWESGESEAGDRRGCLSGRSKETRRSGLYASRDDRRPITVVSGGFPCQPFSTAGKRRGADDDRYLWPELLRIVEELRPSWVVGENVSGLLSIRDGMEIDDMLASLEARNYEPWILHYPAAGVGASHKRDRVFIVAYRTGNRLQREHTPGCDGEGDKTGFLSESTGGCRGEAMAHTSQQLRDGSRGTWRRRDEHSNGREDVADADNTRPQRRQEAAGTTGERARRDKHAERSSDSARSARPNQPRLGRMAHRLSDWMDGEPAGIPRVATGVKDRAARLKALGNAVVPQQAYPIFAAIAEAEEMER